MNLSRIELRMKFKLVQHWKILYLWGTKTAFSSIWILKTKLLEVALSIKIQFDCFLNLDIYLFWEVPEYITRFSCWFVIWGTFWICVGMDFHAPIHFLGQSPGLTRLVVTTHAVTHPWKFDWFVDLSLEINTFAILPIIHTKVKSTINHLAFLRRWQCRRPWAMVLLNSSKGADRNQKR